MKTIENIKTILIVIVALIAVWLYKDYQHQIAENKRQTENISQVRKMDSLRFAVQTYTKKEIEEFLEYQRKDLQEFLREQKINNRKIEQIITQKLSYQDTAKKTIDLQPILDAIKSKENIRVPVKDSTECMIIEGYVVFNNDSLSLDITNRQFTNITDVVSYWERNQWKFLGIKTRLFGKQKVTVVVKDKCGRTETFIVNKK